MNDEEIHRIASTAATWFADLNGHAPRRERGADTRTLPLLRRARSPLEVALIPAFSRLIQGIATPLGDAEIDRLALVAATLGHVKMDDASRTFPQQLAGERGDRRMDPRRFHRLLQTGASWGELHTHSTRAVKLLDGVANVADLSGSLFAWNPRTHKRWALEYYENISETDDP